MQQAHESPNTFQHSTFSTPPKEKRKRKLQLKHHTLYTTARFYNTDVRQLGRRYGEQARMGIGCVCRKCAKVNTWQAHQNSFKSPSLRIPLPAIDSITVWVNVCQSFF